MGTAESSNQLVEREPRPLAAFDLDGTLFKTSMLEAVYAQAYASGYISDETRIELEVFRNAWAFEENNEASYTQYVRRMVHALLDGMSGRTRPELIELVQHTNDGQLRMRRFVRESIALLQRTHHVVIISASLRDITLTTLESVYARDDNTIDPIPNDLIFGSEWEIGPQGLYTGNGTTIDKARTIQMLFARSDFLLAGSCAFGDTVSDAPMLEAVEHGVMVNPSATLRQRCQSNCWRIRESKDEIELIAPHTSSEFTGSSEHNTYDTLRKIGLRI